MSAEFSFCAAPSPPNQPALLRLYHRKSLQQKAVRTRKERIFSRDPVSRLHCEQDFSTDEVKTKEAAGGVSPDEELRSWNELRPTLTSIPQSVLDSESLPTV